MAPISLWHHKQKALSSYEGEENIAGLPVPLWTNAFLKIWCLNFFICIWYFIINAVFPFYIKQLGGSELLVGITAGGYALTAILVRPLAGWFLDHRSRSSILKYGIIGLTIISVLLLLSPILGLAVALRLLSGLVYSSASTASNTNVCDIIPQSRFGEGMGFLGLGNTLATALGPLLGLTIMALYGFKITFAVSGLLVFLAMLVTRGLPYRTIQRRYYLPNRYRLKISEFFNASALPASLVMLFAGAPFGGISVFIALYGEFSGLGNGGLFFVLVALGTGSTRLFSGRLADKKGEQPLIVMGNSSFLLALLLLLWESSANYYVSGLFFGFGFGLSAPAMQTMAIRIVPMNKRGSASSTFLCANDIGSGLGGLAAGGLVTLFGYRPMFAVMCIFTVSSLLIYGLWAAKTPSAFKVYQKNKGLY
ncbi:MAG: MFS transporter [Firmicutes bacterium]|nr:MFS transporter [Bacillota bacterium]